MNKRLPKPYTDGCLDEENNPNYSQSKCLQDCVLSSYLSCDCTLDSSPETGCKILDGYLCSVQGFNNKPVCDCKPSCREETYVYTTTSAAMPNVFALDTATAQGWPTDNITHIQNK